MALKEIALELLRKYEGAKDTKIWEYSGNIYEDSVALRSEVDQYKKQIEDATTVEPERKNGKWNRINYETFHCNLCGCTFIVIQGCSNMNFCPNCSADMKGDTNE